VWVLWREQLPKIVEGLMMNARFLRDEAARFRGMADDADREATRARFVAMAADYEARAADANDLADPNLDIVGKECAQRVLSDEITGLSEPNLGETLRVKPARKIAKSVKETFVVERRPVVRRGLV
jgi:hypothetical protein